MTAAMITLPRLMMVGAGAHKEIVSSLKKLGVTRPLIVTDPYMAESGILARVTSVLDGAEMNWEAFIETVPDPTTEIVSQGTAMLKKGDFDDEYYPNS